MIECVGGYVIRPSYFPESWATDKPDYTFNNYARSFGNQYLCTSFVGQSWVTKLASRTGLDLAGALNDLSYPLARLDHLFTGRYLRFCNEGWVPFAGQIHFEEPDLQAPS
jgi:hypothetical protein